MKKKTLSINLLRKDKKKSFETFIDWALTAGRIIIIITETVALGAFVYRFILDRELSDLHDKITQKQAIIGLWKKDEEKFKNLQDRLAIVSSLSAKSAKTVTLSQEIFALFSPEVSINNIIFSEDKISLVADVPSVDSLKALIDSLKAHPQVTSLSVDQIENKTSTLTISVSLTAILKQEAADIASLEGPDGIPQAPETPPDVQ